MRDQLRRLLELITSRTITLYVVPFDAGFYSLLRWPSVLLEFEDPDEPNLLYVEYSGYETIVRDLGIETDTVGSPANYLDAFFEAENIALDRSAEDLIGDAIAHLGRD